MPPDLSGILSPLTYILHLFHAAALIRKAVDTEPKKSEARYRKEYDKHARLEQRFAPGDYEFVESLTLLESDMSSMAYKRYSKLLPCRTEPHRVLSVGPEYDKINQDGTRNTVSTNRLICLSKERNVNLDTKSRPRANADLDSAREASTEVEKKSYAAEKVVGYENRHTGTNYIARWFEYRAQEDTVGPAKHIPHRLQDSCWRRLGKGQQKRKSTRRKRTIIARR